MDNPVSLRRDGNVAIITIDNPPVNALRHGVRKGIMDSVIAARDDASVEAIVLTGAGRTFVAGADITEFGKPPTEPSLHAVLDLIESCPKPVVSAIHGTRPTRVAEVATRQTSPSAQGYTSGVVSVLSWSTVPKRSMFRP